MRKYRKLNQPSKTKRYRYQDGTWIDFAYPYKHPVQARVMCSDGKRRRTKMIGAPEERTLGIYKASITHDKTSVSGFVAIQTASGEPSASPETGIVKFKANPNGVNAHLLPVGWYVPSHE